MESELRRSIRQLKMRTYYNAFNLAARRPVGKLRTSLISIEPTLLVYRGHVIGGTCKLYYTN